MENTRRGVCILLYVTALVLLTHYASADNGGSDGPLACFHCESDMDPGCLDPFEGGEADSLVLLCQDEGRNDTKCFKMVTTLFDHATRTETILVSRGCGHSSDKDDCTATNSAGSGRSEECYCRGERCNIASLRSLSVAMLVTSTLSVLLYVHTI